MNRELKRIQPGDLPTVSTLTSEIAAWKIAEKTEIATRLKAIEHGGDFLARAEALQAIERQHPGVSKYVAFVIGLLVCLDFTALVMKLSHLISTHAAYEYTAEALRARDLVAVHQLHDEATVARERVAGQAQADQEVDRFGIEVDRDIRMLKHEARWRRFAQSSAAAESSSSSGPRRVA